MPIGISLPSSTVSDTYEEQYSNTNADAGANTTTFTTVPAGEAWIIQGVTAFNTTTKIPAISVRVIRGGSTYVVARIAPTAAFDAVQIYTPLTLFPGDALSFYWNTCLSGDDIYANAIGVKFAIDLGV